MILNTLAWVRTRVFHQAKSQARLLTPPMRPLSTNCCFGSQLRFQVRWMGSSYFSYDKILQIANAPCIFQFCSLYVIPFRFVREQPNRTHEWWYPLFFSTHKRHRIFHQNPLAQMREYCPTKRTNGSLFLTDSGYLELPWWLRRCYRRVCWNIPPNS